VAVRSCAFGPDPLQCGSHGGHAAPHGQHSFKFISEVAAQKWCTFVLRRRGFDHLPYGRPSVTARPVLEVWVLPLLAFPGNMALQRSLFHVYSAASLAACKAFSKLRSAAGGQKESGDPCGIKPACHFLQPTATESGIRDAGSRI